MIRENKAWTETEDKLLKKLWKESNEKTYKAFAHKVAEQFGRTPQAILVRLSVLFKKKQVKIIVEPKTDTPALQIPFEATHELTGPVAEIVHNNDIQISIQGPGVSMLITVESFQMLENKIVCQLKHV